jgi:signal transduction histidine kinase/CheY-like chemotaxis protein
MLHLPGKRRLDMAGERILMIADDPLLLGLCTSVLQGQGYRLNSSTTVPEAVTMARRGKYDLVLAQLDTETRNGLQLLRDIKRLDPSMVGVALTGPCSLDDALDHLRSGADDLVIEPFTPEELTQAVASALEKGRTRKENIRLRALVPLYELSLSFMGVTQLDELLGEILRVSCEESGADRASLMLWDKDDQALTIRAAVGIPEEIVRTTVVKMGEGISGRVAERRRAVVLDSLSPPDDEFRNLMKLNQISSAICVPMTAGDELIGVLNLSKLVRDESPFTAGSLEFCSVLASQAAIAIKNARLFEEVQEAYRELKRLDEAKTKFINVASHELRTPLAVLLGHAQLLQEERTIDVAQQHVQAIIKSALRLKHLVTDMLNLRYLQTRAMELDLQPMMIRETIQAVLDDLGFLATEKDQTIISSVSKDLPPLWADDAKLRLVLSNLISNAIKFTPQGGRIEIAAEASQEELNVSISDTGVGIPPEELSRLFDPFYQVGDSLRREHPGLGLGLSIAKELVELHRGRIRVSSELGKGSTFSFSLSRHLRASN